MNVRRFSTIAIAILAFGASAQADDTKDCVDAFDKGQQFQKRNKLQSAHLVLLVCAREVCPGLVRKDCADLVTQIDAAMPSIILAAKDGSGNDLITVKVEIDGEPGPTQLDGKAIELDPGVHSLHFATQGAAPVVKQVIVKEGQKNQEVAVSFPDLNPPPKPVNTGTSMAERPPQKLGTWQWAGIGVAGAGALGVGVGSVFGVMTSSQWNAAQRDCPVSVGCLPGSKAYQEKGTANDFATVSTAAFIAGGALVAAGAAIYFFAPSKKAISAAIAPGLSGAIFIGTF
jgi:hypothetical protein